MGNCQAAETATTVVQRPDGISERYYCTISASEVIKSYPGHHVALLLSSAVPHGGSPRVTRIKLLRPTDNLSLGYVYRLVSSEEVMKGLKAKKSEKFKKIHGEFSIAQEEINNSLTLRSKSDTDKDIQVEMNKGATNKARAWQPSLQSISESTI